MLFFARAGWLPARCYAIMGRTRCWTALLVACATPPGAAEDPQSVKTLILPGESFLVQQRPAFIFWPPAAKRCTPQPWIMYAPTLPPLPDQHEKWMHQQFSAALIDRYRQAGAADAARLIVVEKQGHNLWEGFFRCQELIDFATKRAQAGAESE